MRHAPPLRRLNMTVRCSPLMRVAVLAALCVGALAQTVEPGSAGGNRVPSSADHLQKQIKDEFSAGKRRVAQNLLDQELQKRETLSVKPSFTWKLGSIQGSAASTYRSFNQSFILVGKTLYRLVEGPGSNDFSTESVAQFQGFLGNVAFVESVEWNGSLYLLAAYEQGLLQLFLVSPRNEVTLHQSLHCQGTPSDAAFFMQDETLFLVVTAENGSSLGPVVVYKWYGTQLDQENIHFLIGATAVSAFPFQESVVIVVAVRNARNGKAGLVMLQHTGSKLEVVQSILTPHPSALQHYNFKSENYILVTSDHGPIVTFWWAGTEMVMWTELKTEGIVRSIGVGYVRGETLILLAEKEKIQIYRPTVTAFQLVYTQEFSAAVQSASLYTRDEFISLLAIAESSGSFVPYILELQLIFQPAAVSHTLLERDPLLQCISSLEDGIKGRGLMLKEVVAQRGQLMRKTTPGQFSGKLIVKKLVPKNVVVQTVVLNGSMADSVVPANQLQKEIAESIQLVQSLTNSLKNIVFKSSPSTLSGRLITDNLKIVNGHMESVTISHLNGLSFDPKNILMYSKDQRLMGTLSVEAITTETLDVGSLNNVRIDDLLKRQGNQMVTALEHVTHVKANTVVIKSHRTINNIPLRRIATTKSPGVISVAGSKTFSGLNLQQLAVTLLNNVNFTQWINSLQPTLPVMPVPPPPTDPSSPKSVSFNGDLKILNLTVHGNINDVPFDDLISSLFLKELRQHITGDVTYAQKVVVDNFESSRINQVPTSSLLTRTTDQTIWGSLSVASLEAPDLSSKSVNGLKMSADVAYINSPFPITTPVSFEHFQCLELILPPTATIATQPIGRRLLSQPKIVYEGSVTIKGTLKLTDVNLEQAVVLLNGKAVDFKKIQQHYWTKDTDQVIHKSLYASNGLNVEFLTISTINNVGLENFVDVLSTKTLQGTWYFPSATIYGNIAHASLAVQYPVSLQELASTIVRTTGNFTVSGKKVFLGGLATRSLTAEYLDSKKIVDLFNRNIRPRGSSFEEIWVGGDLIVKSNLHIKKVNGIDLCKRISKALLVDQGGHIPAAVISAVSASNINVNTFNGVPINVIVGGNQSRVPRVRKLTVTGDVHVPEFINVMTVNNKPPTSDYLSRVVYTTATSTSTVISGKKTFASHFIVEGSFEAPDFNTAKLEDLFKNVLSKTRNQTISAQIWLKEMSAVALKSDIVNNITVGNLLSSDLMSRQTVEGDLMFIDNVDVLGYVSAASFGSGCNLQLVANRLQVLDGRHWTSLNIDGSLNWKNNLPRHLFGLGYYLGSAVTKNAFQIISAEISFTRPVSVNNFNSSRDVNDYDIPSILQDSLKKSLPDQVIYGKKIFSSKLQSTSMQVMGNVVAKTVATVNIAKFNSSLVRVNGDQNVRGEKRFLQGFSASLLKAGSVNGLITSDIVNYDMPLLPPIHFIGPLEISGNLNFERANDLSLDDLLMSRVTLDSAQHLEGQITFTQDLSTTGEMIAPRINSLDIAHLVQCDSLVEQVIRGVKLFTPGLLVDGPMDVHYFGGLDFRKTHQAVLFVDENATIYGNLNFHDVVSMETDLDVVNTVNDVAMAEIAAQLGKSLSRSLGQVTSIARTINDTNLLLKARGDLSQLLYLESVLGVPLSFTNTYRVIAMDIGGNETYLDVYGWVSNQLCGLPTSCACPAQYSVHVSNEGLGHASWNTGLRHKTSERSFTFHLDKPHVAIMVKTNTVSSSSRCRRASAGHLNEVTMLTWVELDHSGDSNEVLSEKTLHIEPTPILGYISDVKVIHVDEHVYLVLGIGYNAAIDTTNINSVIVRIDLTSQEATIVSEFETRGVSSLEVFYTPKGPHIVVGNSYDTSRGSSQVSLDVYRFITRTEQLQLVKSIPADGVVSVVSIVQGGDSLIIVGQKQLYAPVMVLKYDSLHNDYHFIQQLNPNTIPTGLGVFYVGHPGQSDAYLGVSTANDEFYLYKFCHIEGFKLVMKMGLQGVQGFSAFSIGSKQYLFLSSTGTPSVFEIVKQSS